MLKGVSHELARGRDHRARLDPLALPLDRLLGADLLVGERRIGLAPGVELLVPVTHADAGLHAVPAQDVLDRGSRGSERRLRGGVGEQQLPVVGDRHVLVRHRLLDLSDHVRPAHPSDETIQRAPRVLDVELGLQAPVLILRHDSSDVVLLASNAAIPCCTAPQYIFVLPSRTSTSDGWRSGRAGD
jgi:hypothetical protein